MAAADRQQGKRDEQLLWLESILSDKGWTSAQLASAAGFHPSRIVGFRRDRSDSALLDDDTVARIKALTGSQPAQHRIMPSSRPYVAQTEADVIAVTSVPSWFSRELIDDLITQHSTAVPYLIVTNALVATGYRSGGLILVDHNLAPRSNDVVVVSVAGGPPLLRMFTMPMLYTCPFPPDRTQVSLLDDDTEVKGVVACYAFGRLSSVPRGLGAAAFLAAMESAPV
ncbi:hypothetical protein O9X98_05995 [Agrobacterium salinitolerans]|nr:hypothetical protein [Agrobacterium salinitolerans]